MRKKRIAPMAFLSAALLTAFTIPALAQNTNAPPRLTREAWGARPASAGMTPHKPYSIIVHHTGVPQNPRRDQAQKLRNLQSCAGDTQDGGRSYPAALA